MADLIIRPQELAAFLAAVFQKLDVTPDDAAEVADCMVFAHLRGFDTHGPAVPRRLCRKPRRARRINARPHLRIERPMPWSVRVDADNGLGHIAGRRAMREAIEAAKKLGIGAAAIRRSNHFGAASCYSMLAIPADCIGIVTSNAAAAAAPLARWSSFSAPIRCRWRLPTGSAPPFVIDMATTEGSRKKVRQALKQGVPLPAGLGNRQGRQPDDRSAGGARRRHAAVRRHEGLGRSRWLLDILAGVLTGAEFGGRVLSVATNQERESGNGNFMLALKIDAFLPVQEIQGADGRGDGAAARAQARQGHPRGDLSRRQGSTKPKRHVATREFHCPAMSWKKRGRSGHALAWRFPGSTM